MPQLNQFGYDPETWKALVAQARAALEQAGVAGPPPVDPLAVYQSQLAPGMNQMNAVTAMTAALQDQAMRQANAQAIDEQLRANDLPANWGQAESVQVGPEGPRGPGDDGAPTGTTYNWQDKVMYFPPGHQLGFASRPGEPPPTPKRPPVHYMPGDPEYESLSDKQAKIRRNREEALAARGPRTPYSDEAGKAERHMNRVQKARYRELARLGINPIVFEQALESFHGAGKPAAAPAPATHQPPPVPAAQSTATAAPHPGYVMLDPSAAARFHSQPATPQFPSQPSARELMILGPATGNDPRSVAAGLNAQAANYQTASQNAIAGSQQGQVARNPNALPGLLGMAADPTLAAGAAPAAETTAIAAGPAVLQQLTTLASRSTDPAAVIGSVVTQFKAGTYPDLSKVTQTDIIAEYNKERAKSGGIGERIVGGHDERIKRLQALSLLGRQLFNLNLPMPGVAEIPAPPYLPKTPGDITGGLGGRSVLPNKTARPY